MILKQLSQYIIILIYLFCNSPVLGQSNMRNKFFEADYALQLNDYETALKLFKQLQKREPDNALYNYRVGECLLNLPDLKKQSLPYLKVAKNSISTDFKEGNFSETNAPAETYFLLAKAYHLNEYLDSAIYYYNTYLPYTKDNSRISYVNAQIKSCELAKISIKNPVSIKTESLGAPINSELPEIYPVISEDESVLVYLEKRDNTNIVYYTVKEGDKWMKPVNINNSIGSIGDSYPSSISGDKTRLYFTVKDFFTSTICYSTFADGKWTKMKKLKKPVNSKYWNSQAFESYSGDELYFVSDRKGGFGGLDIYKAVKNSKGRWDDPENLGNNINTDLNEIMPVLSPDGNRLYFCSEGHTSIGGYDVFLSVKDASYNWSEPANLGYPINTADDDVYFRPVKDGISAYCSILRTGNISDYDITRLEIIKDEKLEMPLIKEPLAVDKKQEEISVTSSTEETAYDDQTEIIAEVEKPDVIADEKTSEQKKSYTIQFIALKNPVRADYFSNMNDIIIQVGNDGFYRYISGQFNSIDEAKPYLKKIKSSGYKSAFIRNHNLYKYLSANNISPGPLSLSESNPLNPVYTIQIMELHDPVAVNYFKDLRNIKVSYGKDKIFRYTYKEFLTTDSAEADLALIKNKGFKGALIKKITVISNY
jgi:hypothetical protein